MTAAWNDIGQVLTARIEARLEEHANSSLGNLMFLNHLAHYPDIDDTGDVDDWENRYNELCEADDAVSIEDLWNLTEGQEGIQRRIRQLCTRLIAESIQRHNSKEN